MSTNTTIPDLAVALVRYRRTLIVTPLAVAALAVAYGLATREYVAESRFLPRATSVDASRLTGLAAQFGFNLGGGEAGESNDFYANLLKSRDVLLAAAQAQYRVLQAGRTDTVAGTLIDFLHIRGATPEAVRRAAVRAMRARVIAANDPRAGMVVLKVVMPSGELAEQVNRRLLDLVNDFNLRKRQSQAAAERQFTEQRMREAQHELEQAEGELRQFTERNRIVEDPALRLDASRLQRRVDLRQQVFLTLAQAFEQARLAEVRNTPLITIVDAPERSAESSVSVKLSGVLGLLLGFFLGLALVLVREYAARQREEHPLEYAEVADAVRAVPFAALVRRLLRRGRAGEPSQV